MTHDLLVAREQGRFLATRMLASVGAALALSLAMGAVANASSGLVGRLAEVPAAAPIARALGVAQPTITPAVVTRELRWEGRDIDGDGAADFANPTGRSPRTYDAYGSGAFGASRDGGVRHHEGVDYVARAGQTVTAPMSGYVTKIGYAYAGDNDLQFVEITNPALGYEARVFYIDASVEVGDAVALGAPIGKAHTLQHKYPGGMTDHVHLEIAETGKRLDAAKLILARLVTVTETAAD